jgi:DNA replication and repair protein RecF
LYLSKLKVYNYRNLSDQTIEFKNGPVYITGPNGNGKTNLVEALYLLSGSRSFRTNSQAELVQWGKSEASVFGTVETKNGQAELGITISLGQKSGAKPAGQRSGQREAFINGTALQSVADLMGSCSVVAFSPVDLSLVKGAPAGRRKFLDRHIVDLQPAFLSLLMAYQRALESKSALLKSPTVTPRDLYPWNELLVEYGGKIVDNRVKFLEGLIKKSTLFHTSFAQPDGALMISLESDLLNPDGSVLSTEELRREFDRVASREISLRSCVFGPHRDDIAITLGGVDSRAYASQGQTRTIVLALKLGVIELLEERLGESPIVILDDVDSELDAQRTKQLFQALAQQERQIFITGTAKPAEELSQPGRAKVELIEVREGVVGLAS